MKRFILTVIATMLMLVNFGNANAQLNIALKGIKATRAINATRAARATRATIIGYAITNGYKSYLQQEKIESTIRSDMYKDYLKNYSINKKKIVMVDASKMRQHIINGLKSANTTLTSINTNMTRALFVCFQHFFTSRQRTKA